MKRELRTLPVSGRIEEIETVLNSTAVNGFPIVTNDARQALVGYIGRREVRYVIGTLSVTALERWWADGPVEMASKVQDIRPDTPFSFAGDEGVAGLNTPGFRSVGPIIGIEDELSAEVVESTSTGDVVKFWPWVQQVKSHT